MRSCCYHDEFSFRRLLSLVASSFRTRAALQAEILALRHQLTVLQKQRLSLHNRPMEGAGTKLSYWSTTRRSAGIVIASEENETTLRRGSFKNRNADE
jgi:hypothetical protein